jgi:hypothetical protein
LEAEESSILMMLRRRKFNGQSKMTAEESKEIIFESIVCESVNLFDWTSGDNLFEMKRGRVWYVLKSKEVFNQSGVGMIDVFVMPKILILAFIFSSESLFKSNSYAWKHQPVAVGQWSPSSSEDG